MIVLDEAAWVKEHIQNQDLGGNTKETLSRVARYYYSQGKRKDEIKRLITQFFVTCRPNIVLVKYDDFINAVVKNCDRYPIVKITDIPITNKEIKVINSLERVQIRRLAFTLLCVAKYYNTINEKNNDWVASADSDIMSMANINTNIRRQSAMYHSLCEMGLIGFSKRVESLRVQVLFIDKESDISDSSNVAMNISSFENLGNQYEMYCGGPFFECAECGKVVRRNSNAQKFCKDCSKAVHLRKSVESMTALRNGKSRL